MSETFQLANVISHKPHTQQRTNNILYMRTHQDYYETVGEFQVKRSGWSKWERVPLYMREKDLPE